MLYRYSKGVPLAFMILLLSTFADFKDSCHYHYAIGNNKCPPSGKNHHPQGRDRYPPKNHGPIPRRPTFPNRDAGPSPDAAEEEPKENGCKGLEGGKKYLVSDIGEMLARCFSCGPSVGSKQSVGVHGKRGDGFAQWTFEPVGDKCAIKSDIGAYAGRCNGCWRKGAYPDSLFNHVETASPESPYSLWEVEKHGDSYSFKADTGKYMARCRGCVPGGTKKDFAFVHATSPTGPALWGVLSA